MKIGQWRIRGDWGHLVFILGIATITVFYLVDVVSVSMNINNIILVLPLAILLLGLALIVIFRCLHFERVDTSDGSTNRGNAEPVVEQEKKMTAEDLEPEQSIENIVRAFFLLVGVGAYVALYEIIGLDAATFLFVLGSLFLLGVRGWLFVPFYSVIFTFIVVGGVNLLLSYPMPMLLF